MIRDFASFSHAQYLIAPYWADLSTNQGGDILYRTSKDEDTLQRARSLTQEQFPNLDFQPTNVTIVTWYKVPHESIDLGVNTFQVALVYNREISFIFFFYNETSVPSNSVVIGFSPPNLNADSFMIPRNNTDNVESNSNTLTGVPGFYAYRTDLNMIIQPRGMHMMRLITAWYIIPLFRVQM